MQPLCLATIHSIVVISQIEAIVSQVATNETGFKYSKAHGIKHAASPHGDGYLSRQEVEM